MPALSSRDKIYHFGTAVETNWTNGHDFDADFVFVNKQDDYTGYGGVEVPYKRTTERLSLLLKRDDYEVVKEDRYFILFRNKNYRGLDGS